MGKYLQINIRKQVTLQQQEMPSVSRNTHGLFHYLCQLSISLTVTITELFITAGSKIVSQK